MLTVLEFVLKQYYCVEAGRTLCAEAAVPCGMRACVCVRARLHVSKRNFWVCVCTQKYLRGAGVGADAADAEDAAAVGDELPVDYPSPGVEHHLYIYIHI